jgi:hypothetical protein
MHKLDRGIREFPARKQARKIDSDSTDGGLIKIQQSAKNFEVPTQLILKTARFFDPGCLYGFIANFIYGKNDPGDRFMVGGDRLNNILLNIQENIPVNIPLIFQKAT